MNFNRGIPDKAGIADFALASYYYEPGTRYAVDKRKITMEELTIYHFANAWANHNMPDYDTMEEFDELLWSTWEKSLMVTCQEYRISLVRAREIVNKIRKIPRARVR